MNKQQYIEPNEVRALNLAISQFSTIKSDKKNSDFNLLHGYAYISDSLKKSIYLIADENIEQQSTKPLTSIELCSFNNWFRMHPEKVAGDTVITTSIYFPLQIKGDKNKIIEVLENGLEYELLDNLAIEEIDDWATFWETKNGQKNRKLAQVSKQNFQYQIFDNSIKKYVLNFIVKLKEQKPKKATEKQRKISDKKGIKEFENQNSNIKLLKLKAKAKIKILELLEINLKGLKKESYQRFEEIENEL